MCKRPRRARVPPVASRGDSATPGADSAASFLTGSLAASLGRRGGGFIFGSGVRGSDSASSPQKPTLLVLSCDVGVVVERELSE
jgi:hypothetical protein